MLLCYNINKGSVRLCQMTGRAFAFGGEKAIANQLLRFCKHPGCGELTQGGWCDKHKPEAKVYISINRPPDKCKKRASAHKRGYTYRWQTVRKDFLSKHPWCAECQRQGRLTTATEVDHIIPHKGDRRLFWDRSNWQPLCHSCHSRKTAREDGGFGRVSPPQEKD